MARLTLEKDISRTQNSRHRKSKHSKFHDEVSKLLQDACLRDSFVVEGKERIASLMNKKHGSFKTKNDHEIYFTTQTVDKWKRLTRFFVKSIYEVIKDENSYGGVKRRKFEKCPCNDCSSGAKT